MNALENSGMADNTWIVVFSDHGWHLGEKEHIAKQTLWTRSTRLPCHCPAHADERHAARMRCDQPVELLDVYPTLVEATGLTPKRTSILMA